MNKKPDDVKQLRNLSVLLDTKFQGPMGIRFGLDALIGLIPGVGDFVTSAISLYIISQAAQLGVGSATLIRMAINVIFENIIDMIPFVGNIFDFYWKANTKNLALIEQHLAHPSKETVQSRIVVVIIFVVLLAILVAAGYGTFLILEALYSLITSRLD